MEFFVGLDVSLDETHLCVVDEGGRIVKEGRCASEPRAIAKAIRHQGRWIEHVGLETGNLSQWLHEGLTREGFSVVVMEARHVCSALSAMRVKTDRNDARGIAQLVRLRALLMEELAALDTRLIAMAKADPVTRLLMTVPGVGVIVALSFRSAIDDPDRFKRTRDVGPWLGLTPRRWQSGQTDVVGRITKAGDARVRTMLFEAAAALLGRARRVCALKAWGLRIAQRTSMKRAIVATARKLATVLLAMWRSDTAYWSVPEATAA